MSTTTVVVNNNQSSGKSYGCACVMAYIFPCIGSCMWYDCQCHWPVIITWFLGWFGYLPAAIWNLIDIGCNPADRDMRVNRRLGRANNSTTTVVTTTAQPQPVVVAQPQPVVVAAQPVVVAQAQPVQTTVVATAS